MAKKLNKKNQARLESWLTGAQKSFQIGNYSQAESLCKKILKLQPGNLSAHQILGDITYNLNRFAEAIEHLKVLLKHQADDVLYCRLGLAFAQLSDYKSAFNTYQQALKINPRAFQAYNNLGLAFVKINKINEAIKAFANALNINNNYAEAHYNVATQLDKIGRFSDAVTHYRLALDLNPKFHQAHRRLLYLQSRYSLCTSAELLKQHEQWDETQNAKLMSSTWLNISNPDPDRQLRIGYVSSAFNRHDIGVFIEPLLIFHSKNNVESYCYAELDSSDELSDRLAKLCDHWCETKVLSDIELERAIRKDKIDILVSLDGHNLGSRLPVFTYRPAPIQVNYLGYPASTGLKTMDYWIGDQVNHSQENEESASEQIYRLPRCFVCYQPPEDAPEIQQKNYQAQSIVFGVSAELLDISTFDMECWAEILLAMPSSQLFVKTQQTALPIVHENFIQQLKSLGIEEARITVKQGKTTAEHYQYYDEMDILLDTVSDSNSTFICDALWMGLPVITLKGNRFAQSLTASILTGIGNEGWITTRKEDFIGKILELANKPDVLSHLRLSQRQKIAQSELCNAFGLTHSLEQAYREMWIKYLAEIQNTTDESQSIKYATV